MLRLARALRRSLSNPCALLGGSYTYIAFLSGRHERMLSRALSQPTQQWLFVCKGNVCRSPLAAAYIEAGLEERGYKISVCSAGLETTAGKEAHPLAKAIAQQYGLSLQAHLTTRLTQELVHQASLILVMEFAQRSRLLQAYPEARGKVFQLSHFYSPWLAEIADPYSGTPEDFEACYQVIRQSCDNLLQRIVTLGKE